MNAVVAPKSFSHILLAINKKNNRHTTPKQTHISIIMPRQKGIVRCHKSVTWNNRGRQQKTPCDNRCFNFKESHQIALSCNCWWYLWLIHWTIQSLISIIYPRFVNSNPALHRTQRQIRKLIKYLVGLHLIRQITCHRRTPRMEVAVFIDSWWMCLSWHRHNDNRMP